MESLDIGNDIEGNNMCNDWTVIFCKYVMDDLLNGSFCHLSEIDDECMNIFSVSIFIAEIMILTTLCTSCFLLSTQIKSIQIKSNKESNDTI